MIQCNPILDSEYKENMTIEQGKELALKCINAAMKRDPATGEGIDLYVVNKEEIKQETRKEVRQELVEKKS